VLWNLCQRYNLKAIHNCFDVAALRMKVVESMSKIQSESNSQRTGDPYLDKISCGIYVKDTI